MQRGEKGDADPRDERKVDLIEMTMQHVEFARVACEGLHGHTQCYPWISLWPAEP